MSAPPVSDNAEPATGSWWRRRLRWVVAGVVVLVLLVVAGVVVATVLSDRSRDRALTAAARDQVLALVAVDPASARPSFDRAVAGSTGEWRRRLAASEDTLVGGVTASRVSAQATGADTAIQRADGDTAQVLVTVSLTTSSAAVPAPTPRTVRAAVALADVDDRWLVTDVAFVR